MRLIRSKSRLCMRFLFAGVAAATWLAACAIELANLIKSVIMWMFKTIINILLKRLGVNHSNWIECKHVQSILPANRRAQEWLYSIKGRGWLSDGGREQADGLNFTGAPVYPASNKLFLFRTRLAQNASNSFQRLSKYEYVCQLLWKIVFINISKWIASTRGWFLIKRFERNERLGRAKIKSNYSFPKFPVSRAA